MTTHRSGSPSLPEPPSPGHVGRQRDHRQPLARPSPQPRLPAGLPLTPVKCQPRVFDYVAATRILEEAIVQKVFREDLTSPSDPASVRNELWGILRRTILHDSKEAKRFRTELFATTLAQLAVDSSDERIQSAAQHLCDLLTSPVADLPTE